MAIFTIVYVLAAIVVCAAAVTTNPSVIQTTLQIKAAADEQRPPEQHPSFAARYWKQQRDFATGPSESYTGDDYDFEPYSRPAVPQPPHKLSAAQQVHILDDIRRHNQQQQHQWWTAPSPTARPQPEPAIDQLQQLLQINGVEDEDTTAAAADDRDGKQRSVGSSGDWQPQPQPPQLYNNNNNRQQQQQHLSLSPYVSPPPSDATVSQSHYNHRQQQTQQYYQPPPQSTTTTSMVPTILYDQQHFVTTPTSSAPVPMTTANNQQQQQQQQYYPHQHQQQDPSTVLGLGGDVVDPDIEHQIRQQLTAVAGAGVAGNFTILNSLKDVGAISPSGNHHRPTHITVSASNDHVRYVQIGSGTGSSQNRVQQQVETSSANAAAAGGNRNTIVKTVVVHQKPPVPTTTPQPAVVTQQQKQPWTVSEQQQLEQLARQVLPPGVAQYEIIRAGGVDGVGGKGGGDAIAGVGASPAASVAAEPQAPAKKKPVTFVILEERPDGTVRVRGIEKKQHGPPASGAEESGSAVAAADDEQLQQLVDKLNRGELRLPTGSAPAAASSNVVGPDNVVAASTTARAPLPTSSNKHREPQVSTSYYPTVTPQITTAAVSTQRHHHQNFFLPTAVPTIAAVATTTTAGGGEGQQQHQNRYHHNHNQQHKQQQQQYRPTPAVASSTTLLANTTLSHNNKAPKEGIFSSALRRRGYYAMAKYMRQAGVDAVLEETGPFTLFVPTDKAFRALLVQLGGPDRAEDKFRENPRLLIGLLLHHVVPGAFKVADLMAGDEMTGVSLAGTQLRANLYARQLYDNRWNDIEVLTVNGARVLDDVVPATGDGAVSADDVSHQQRRDMVLAPGGTVAANQQVLAVGHAVDRVLFPLPVGDVLATMRSDRQHRYNVFLRAVDEYCSTGVRDLLTGSRTVTVFAPVDDAFRPRRGSGNHSASGSIMDKLLRDDVGLRKSDRLRRVADRFVLSHVVLAGPGDPPMFTAGLRFYQVKDTAYRLSGGESGDPGASEAYGEYDGGGGGEDADASNNGDGNLTLPRSDDGDKPRFYQLTVYKDSGRIRLNGGVAQVLVRNVPATNGVLHGIDAPLV